MKLKTEQQESEFSVGVLSQTLFEEFGFGENTCFVVAYSGGCDSQVLLHALAGLRKDKKLKTIAAHFDHGLHAQSVSWAESCKSWCDQLNIEFIQVRRQIQSSTGESVEANARIARYQWLEEICDSTQIVLTAHHTNDQAETFLLNLFQGKEVDQLAGIAPLRPLVHGSKTQLCRPLLRFSKKQIGRYAHENELQWIEDPSNRNTKYYRNYIRHELLPVLVRRRPDLVSILNKGADLSRAITKRNNAMLSKRYARYLSPELKGVYCLTEPLALNDIDQFDEFEVISLIRYWIHQAGYASPSHGKLETLYQQIPVKKATQAAVSFNGVVVRYFNNHLHLTEPVTRSQLMSNPQHETHSLVWDLQPLDIPDYGISVELSSVNRMDNNLIKLRRSCVNLRWRGGGERIQLKNRHHSSSLKKLFQLNRVPPWERDNLPFLEIDNQIVWVYGLGWSAGYAGESGCAHIYPRFSRIND